MLTVGVTGGVASGKSTVTGMLAQLGAPTRDADEVVRDLYRPGRAGARAVADLFGAGVLTAAGGVDHAALAAVALADGEARRRLEQAIHPLVIGEIDAWLADLARSGGPPSIAVIEAALLVETGLYRSYHRLVAVSAAAATRRARALTDGWSETAFERVLAAQADDAGREAAADYVVRNDGTVDELRAAVGELWLSLRDDAALLMTGRPLPRRKP